MLSLSGYSGHCPEDHLKSAFIFSEGVLKMAMRKEVRHLYEFGPYCLDAAERLLTCEGRVVSLAPKVLDTLLVLVENSGRVMEKEELLKTLWPDSYVEESNLTTYVSQLRKALGENGEGQLYIETVPRRGYRFIADVKKTQADWDNFLVHERTDMRILIEEEITAPDLLPAAVVIHAQPLPASTSATYAATPQLTPTQTKMGAALIAVCVLALVAFGTYLWSKRLASEKNLTSPFQSMTITKLTANGKIPLAAISPDGKYLAHVLHEMPQQSLWVRQTSTTSNMSIVPPAAVRFLMPTFSPDGNYIYYVTYAGKIGTLYQVPTLGGTPRKLIEDVDSPVTFSPDGKRIAFFRHEPQTKETTLLIADTEAQNQTKLLMRPYAQRFSQDSMGFHAPTWSPDGKTIACAVLKEEAGNQLFNVIQIEVASGKTSLLTTKQWHWVGQVAWLPDGAGLVANAWDQGTSTVSDQIWHVALPSGATTRVTNDVNSYKGLSVAAKTGNIVTVQVAQVSRLWIMPVGDEKAALPITSGFGENYSDFLGVAWTKEGRIVYGSNASGNADLWIMDQDGKNQKQLTTTAERDMTPAVSPDGKYIVFITFTGKIPHVMRIDMDGNNPKQLTNGQGEVSPTVSPDGQWVLYTAYEGEKQAIYKLPIEGGTATRLTDFNYLRAEYSPDGKWLACIQVVPETGAKKVAILPATGGAPSNVIENFPFARWTYLRWFPDSQAITMAADQAGVGNIYKYSINSQTPEKITDFKSDWIYRYAWSGDGKSLAVERGLPINDVILISDLK
jgi:Tol biopolymer transport system component/DNA-binding winged helix-turn-helix (wHTH) protein